MYRWIEIKWREEIEPVKWKYAWNCDKKRKRARERASLRILKCYLMGKIDNRHMSSMIQFCGCCQAIIVIIFFYRDHCGIFKYLFTQWFARFSIFVNTHAHARTSSSFKHMENVKLLTIPIFSPFFTWIVEYYANNTVCHDMLKNSKRSKFIRLFFTPFISHDLYFVHLFADNILNYFLNR